MAEIAFILVVLAILAVLSGALSLVTCLAIFIQVRSSRRWREQQQEQPCVLLDSSKTAAVDKGYHWTPIDSNTPRGVKLQLISKPSGVAEYASLSARDDFWTHWAPLPTFKD